MAAAFKAVKPGMKDIEIAAVAEQAGIAEQFDPAAAKVDIVRGGAALGIGLQRRAVARAVVRLVETVERGAVDAEQRRLLVGLAKPV